MSYPPPQYHGGSGEVSARLRPAGSAPAIERQSGLRVHYLATGESTHGEFGLYRWDFGPGPSGPDPHFHRTISESFYVLSGALKLYDGTRWVDATEGDFLYVPQGGLHGFRNESGERASMLILFTPGAPREEYFERVAEVAGSTELTDEEKAAFYVRHDTYWPGRG